MGSELTHLDENDLINIENSIVCQSESSIIESKESQTERHPFHSPDELMTFCEQINIPNINGCEIKQVKSWNSKSKRNPNENSLRGLVWYHAIGNDLNISWNTYNDYKVTQEQIKRYDMIHNKNKCKIQSIFDIDCNENKTEREEAMSMDISYGLKRRDSINKETSRMYKYKHNVDTLDNISETELVKLENIESVLIAYCNYYNKDSSYSQFMINLVDMLLDYQIPQIAFISLCNILNYDLFDMIINFKECKLEKGVKIFTDILQDNAYKLAMYLYELSPINYHILDSFILECIQSLFTTQLRHNIVAKIWDLYFLNGEVIIWQCSVALLITADEHLSIVWKQLNIHNIMKILQCIDKLLTNIDTEYFINKINLITIPNNVRRQLLNK